MSSSLSYVLQIFTGGFNSNAVTYKNIEHKLSPLLGVLPIRAVIAGWQINKPLYKQLKELLSKHNIPLYLWVPVFSEIGDVVDGDPIIIYTGRKPESVNLNDGEGFEFLCPTSIRNQNNVIKVFSEYFDADSCDGVFLDRIRYPSFSNGYESIFSCFCPRCIKLMENAGLPVEQIKKEIVYAKGKGINPFSIDEITFPYNKFSNDMWRDFFDFKHNSVTNALSYIAKYFKDLGKNVGLDVFTPSIAEFIGQDIVKLSRIADFIKPMMYYKTFAPAGIFYESAILEKGFTNRVIGKSAISNDKNIDADTLDELARQSICDIYPGFEVNRIDNIADTSIEYIEEQLTKYDKSESIASVVLSWNLLDMPKEHLEYIINR